MTTDQLQTCPKCHTLTWALIPDPNLPGNDLLRCNECGFEVDMRVVKQFRWIVRNLSERDFRPPLMDD